MTNSNINATFIDIIVPGVLACETALPAEEVLLSPKVDMLTTGTPQHSAQTALTHSPTYLKYGPYLPEVIGNGGRFTSSDRSLKFR